MSCSLQRRAAAGQIDDHTGVQLEQLQSDVRDRFTAPHFYISLSTLSLSEQHPVSCPQTTAYKTASTK
jgi:hypothetical protein